jgi:chromosome partitioning protein
MLMALANSKGGVGKSTIAVHLAVWMAEQGHKFVFVDSDVQGSSSAWLKEASPNLATVRLVTPDDILDQLPKLSVNFEHVVIDGPAGLSEVTRSILYLSDIAIFPCGPSVLDLRAAIDAVEVTRKIQEIRGGLPHAIIIPNKLQPQYRLSRELLDTVRNLGMPAGDGLCLRQAYADAAGQGTVVWRMNSPGARAATAELQFFFQQLFAYESTSNPPNHGRRLAAQHSGDHA